MSLPAALVVDEPSAAAIVLNTIRRPVIMINADGLIGYANADAEDFFRSSAAVLARNTLARFVPFGSPILTLVDQVRERAVVQQLGGARAGEPELDHPAFGIERGGRCSAAQALAGRFACERALRRAGTDVGLDAMRARFCRLL